MTPNHQTDPSGELTPELPPDAILGPLLERPPFTGFLLRLAAFLIDMGVLYGLAYGLDRMSRPALLEMNPALPWIGHLVALGYFWLAQGPPGRGHTAGKAILGLQVVDAQGRPLGWSAALRHALVQQAAFFVLIDPDLYIGIFPVTVRFEATAALTMVSVACLTLVITLAVAIAMHPHKRGWHNLWAGDYVTRDPLPGNFLSTLAAAADLLNERRIVFVPRMTVVFWLLATGLLLMKPISILRQPEVTWRARLIEQAQIQNDLAPFYIAQVQFPNTYLREGFEKYVQYQREQLREAGEPVPTTETLRRQALSDGETILLKMLRRQGQVTVADLQDAALQRAMEGVRAQLWAAWQARLANAPATTGGAASPGSGSLLPAREFNALLYEANPLLFDPFALLFQNNAMRLRATVRGPADPAAGPLVFKEIEPPPPPASAPAVGSSPAPENRIDDSATSTTQRRGRPAG